MSDWFATLFPGLLINASMNIEPVSNVIWQKAASPTCQLRGGECNHRHERWAGSFARGGRLAISNALMCRYVTMGRIMSPSKVPLSRGELDLRLIHGSLDPYESASQTASRSVLPFLHSSPMCSTQ